MTLTVFVIFFIGPGPQCVARVLAGQSATPAEIASISRQLCLNQPWYSAVLAFPRASSLHGNLGYDYYNSVPVTTSIRHAFPITALAADRGRDPVAAHGTGDRHPVRGPDPVVLDRFFTTLALFFYSMPTFVLGLLFILYLYQVLTTHGGKHLPRPWVPGPASRRTRRPGRTT